MSNSPLLSIVTVHYGKVSDIQELKIALDADKSLNFEWIIVDNASPESIPSDFLDNISFPANCIYTKENLGFAGGNNVALESCNAPFILFLNSDAVVQENCLSELVHYIQTTPNCGIVSPIITYSSQAFPVQYAGLEAFHPITLRSKSKWFGLAKAEVMPQISSGITQRPHGAALCISKEILQKVGNWPEDYFLYYEEMELGLKVQKMGFDIHLCKSAWVVHQGSASIGKASAFQTYWMNRSRLRYIQRNLVQPIKALSLVYHFGFALPVTVLRLILKRQFDSCKALIRAYIAGLK